MITKKLRYAIVCTVMVLVLVLTAFFFWGSAATLSDGSSATLTTYDASLLAAAPADTFTVMTYNIGYLVGMTNNRPMERTKSFVAANQADAATMIADAAPDIIGFQEIDIDADRTYGVNQVDALARQGGYAMAATAVNWDKRYVPFPYGWPWWYFGRVVSGQAVLSRYPIQKHLRTVLERPPSPFYYDAFYIDRVAQVTIIDVGQPLVVINVHLEAYDQATRERQAEAVLALYRQYKDQYAVMLIGDFNSILPQDRSSLPDHRGAMHTDRTMEIFLAEETLEAAFVTVAVQREAHGEAVHAAAAYTFSSAQPMVKIDHLLYHSGRLAPLEVYVVEGPGQPSDHRAVVGQFRFIEQP